MILLLDGIILVLIGLIVWLVIDSIKVRKISQKDSRTLREILKKYEGD